MEGGVRDPERVYSERKTLMNQFFNAIKTKMLTDLYLYLDYWYVWCGIIVVLVGIRLYILYKHGH